MAADRLPEARCNDYEARMRTRILRAHGVVEAPRQERSKLRPVEKPAVSLYEGQRSRQASRNRKTEERIAARMRDRFLTIINRNR